MANILQAVQTYQMAGLAYLQNLNCFLATSNMKFDNFQDMTGNLGDTVTFDLPPRFTTTNSLVANFQDVEQRKQSLTVDQPVSSSYAFTNQEQVFNLDANDYLKEFGYSAIQEIGAQIENFLAKRYSIDHTYRFYGDGSTAINSYTQLATALAQFRNYGAAKGNISVYLPDLAVPQIVGTGHGQFTPRRNDETANSWFIGNWMGVDYYQSNFAPIHTAGTVGRTAVTLTIDAIDPTGTILTLSGAAPSDADALKEGDLLTVGKAQGLKFLKFIGHSTSGVDVQVRVTADAASDVGGIITATVFPALVPPVPLTRDSNLSAPIVPSTTTVTSLPSHQAGLICSGNAKFLAMPRLPDEDPFKTASTTDPETGASLRLYTGSVFGNNQRGIVHDAIYGATSVDEYSMRMAFPVPA
jgi:hypothetical protein